jgi:hypothetical protein
MACSDARPTQITGPRCTILPCISLSPSKVLVWATLATVAYTALVWWLCEPIVRALARPSRRNPR